MKLCIFVGTTIGGSIGWSVAEDYGFMAAFIVSGIGSILGVYAGWAIARRLLN